MRLALFFLAGLVAVHATIFDARGSDPRTAPSPPPEYPGQTPATHHTDTKIIPLPIYATLPNEGNTFGFMPVFLVVDGESQHTDSIIAPSISWNAIIRWTTTFRLYAYPDEDESFTFIPSLSSNINRNITLEYQKLPWRPGQFTREGWFHFRRTVFSRFFGLGPYTSAGSETSYTSLGGDVGGRIGFNAARSFNVGLVAQLERQLVERKHVGFLPLTNDYFPGTPGLGGSTEFFEGLSVRFDTRPEREYSTTGTWAELSAGAAEGIVGTSPYGKISFESRALWHEIPGIFGGARFYTGYAAGSGIPFYDQNSLGGSFLLRGFTEGRFVDKGAWTAELEQRITLLKTHIYGVVADWRVDPFVAIGQVYHDFSGISQKLRYAGGLGFRAFVRPNVLGRVDTAIGGEGIKVYVELGYPF